MTISDIHWRYPSSTKHKTLADDDDGKLIDTRYHQLVNNIHHPDDCTSYSRYQVQLSFIVISDTGIVNDTGICYHHPEDSIGYHCYQIQLRFLTISDTSIINDTGICYCLQDSQTLWIYRFDGWLNKKLDGLEARDTQINVWID